MERKHWHQALPRACGSPSWEDISPSALAASLVAVFGMLMPQRPSITTLGSLSQDFHPWITAREDTTEPGRDFSGQQHQPSCSREFTSGKGESWFQGWFGFKLGQLRAGDPQHWGDSAPQHLQALEGLGAQKWDRGVELEQNKIHSGRRLKASGLWGGRNRESSPSPLYEETGEVTVTCDFPIEAKHVGTQQCPAEQQENQRHNISKAACKV